MASSGNLKDLSKAIATFLAATPALPLPEDILDQIDAYLRKHHGHEDACPDSLHEELLAVFRKHVEPAGTPDSAPNSVSNPVSAPIPVPITNHPAAPFLAVVHRLSSHLQTPARLQTWWDLGRDLVDALVRDRSAKALAEAAAAGWAYDLLGFGDPEDGTDPADGPTVNPLVERLVEDWAAGEYGGGGAGGAMAALEYGERVVRDVVLQYGKKKPRRLFLVLDTFFVRRRSRKAVLALLVELLQNQPPHLHLILQTPLFPNLLRCLQLDTSTSVVSAALTTIIMLLPNMPSSLVPHLSSLFNIYVRLLFWSRDRVESADATTQPSSTSAGWEACTYAPDQDSLHVPRLTNYFTLLYGLYPINFMEYIRKPQRYLRHFDALDDHEVEIEATEIRQKSDMLRQYHLLHPNFYTMTVEAERTDFGRWIKSEPADVAAECMSLCLASEGGLQANHGSMPPPGLYSDENEALLSGGAAMDGWRNTHSASPASSRVPSALVRRNSQSSQPSVREEAKDSPTLGSLPAVPGSPRTHLQDMLQSNKAIKLAISQSLPNDSVPSLSLSHTELDRLQVGSPPPMPDLAQQVAFLQQQTTLLQNDLRFERYLRQQHVAHIGSLRRRQLAEVTTEAETQNLILSSRNLRLRLEESRKAEAQARREMDLSRTRSKNWEADIYAKMKVAREEAKRLKAEVETLTHELSEAREEHGTLRQIICAAEDRELTSRQLVQSVMMDAAEIERLRGEVERLTVAERTAQAREAEMYHAKESAREAEHHAEMARMVLEATETELRRTREDMAAEADGLRARLAEAEATGKKHGGGDAGGQVAALESALASVRSRHAELQKQYTLVSKKYSALHATLLDMRADGATGMAGFGGLVDGDETPGGGVRNRPHRGFSDPESVGGGQQQQQQQQQQQHQNHQQQYQQYQHPLHGTSSGLGIEGVAFNVTPPLDGGGRPLGQSGNSESARTVGGGSGGGGGGGMGTGMGGGTSMGGGSSNGGGPNRIRKEPREAGNSPLDTQGSWGRKDKRTAGLRRFGG